MEKITVDFMLNGKDIHLLTFPNRTLLKVLRENLSMPGTKDGCQEGECGACTVLFDEKPMNSCLILIGQVNGHSITTIEGISQNGEMHPVQKAFVKMGAVQCGFCTPGFILSTVALLKRSSDPSEEEIKSALAGNLCRCTGYTKIIDAVNYAAKELRDYGKNE